MATTVNDKIMYVVLVLAIVANLYATALGSASSARLQLPRIGVGVVPLHLGAAAPR